MKKILKTNYKTRRNLKRNIKKHSNTLKNTPIKYNKMNESLSSYKNKNRILSHIEDLLNSNNKPQQEITYAIRFYDNQNDIIKQFNTSKKYIDAIKVSSEPNKDIPLEKNKSYEYTSKFLSKYPQNAYAIYLNEMKNRETDACVGFSIEDSRDLREWATNSDVDVKTVIFDWDGTLSVVEGLIVPPIDDYELFTSGEIPYRDVGIYYSGSKERFDILRTLFRNLQKLGVEIYILTNNPVAMKYKSAKDNGFVPYSRTHFHNIVRQIIPGIRDDHIMCGYETGGFKPSTFSNNDNLRNMYNKMHSWYMRNKT